MKDNLKLWKSVELTDPNYTKKVNQRGGFTAISAAYQFKKATESFGAYGHGWGVRDCKYDYVSKPNGEIVEVVLEAIFYYTSGTVEGVFELSTCMPYRVGNDTRKKLLTDLTTKALSKLGFSADIFMGLFDDNKYIGLAMAATERKGLKEISEAIKMLKEFPKVMEVWNGLDIIQQNDPKIKALFAEKKQDLADETAPIAT